MRLSGLNAGSDMRSALSHLSLLGGYRSIHMMDSRQVTEAVRDAVEHGELIFVPEREALRECVKAIQEDREKRPAPVAQQQQRENPYGTVQQMMGKPPRVPGGLNTPLSEAQPFDYEPDMPGGDAEDIADMPIKDGPPNTWVENPSGSGQLRFYDVNGNAAVDFDFDHDHGFGIPHAHNWDGGTRDLGNAVSLLPY